MKPAFLPLSLLRAETEHVLAPLGFEIIGRLRAWLKKRAVLAELERLDARTLADLRISRGDFVAIAEGTYVRHCADLDEIAPAETTGEAFRPYPWPYY
jgi:uncharacterized protein YjiS (DUF1127 family)